MVEPRPLPVFVPNGLCGCSRNPVTTVRRVRYAESIPFLSRTASGFNRGGRGTGRSAALLRLAMAMGGAHASRVRWGSA